MSISRYTIDIDNNVKKTGEQLGKGRFGTVEKCFYTRKEHKVVDTIPCALKRFNPHIFNNDVIQRLRIELIPQFSLSHPAILKTYGYSMPIMGQGDFCILMEYAPNKSLKYILTEEDKATCSNAWSPTKKAISIFGIAAGMLYMHQHKLIHRDLKTDNILLDENYYPKITDFGIAKSVEESSEHLIRRRPAGTPAYMAPEIHQSEPYNNKVDVFSFAIILYEIFTCKVPNEDRANKNPFVFGSYLDGKRPTLDSRFPEFFQQLITECWANLPDERPSFAQILIRLKNAFYNEEIFEDEIYERGDIEDYLDMVLANLELEDPDDSVYTADFE